MHQEQLEPHDVGDTGRIQTIHADNGFCKESTHWGEAGIAQWLEHRTRD